MPAHSLRCEGPNLPLALPLSQPPTETTDSMLSTGDIPLDKCLCWPWQERQGETTTCCWPWCKMGTTQLCAYPFGTTVATWSLDWWTPKPMESSSVTKQRGVLMVQTLGLGAERRLHPIYDRNPKSCHTNSDNHLSPLQDSQLVSPATEVLQQHQYLPTFTAGAKYQLINFLQLRWRYAG